MNWRAVALGVLDPAVLLPGRQDQLALAHPPRLLARLVLGHAAVDPILRYALVHGDRQGLTGAGRIDGEEAEAATGVEQWHHTSDTNSLKRITCKVDLRFTSNELVKNKYERGWELGIKKQE